ncbi:MAG: hypothetical protein ABIK28_08675, partial [Planctomycetota bacterium]
PAPDLARAIRMLIVPPDPNRTEAHDVNELAPETLGALYESLLPYFPRILRHDFETGSVLSRAKDPSRTERRRTGSYYTARKLVVELVRSALIPVLLDRLGREGLPVRSRASARKGLFQDYRLLTRKERQKAERILLRSKVVDPACGGAVFLMTAQDFLAEELLRLRYGQATTSEPDKTKAFQDVMLHCIHGVDKDPLAVELARISLWLNTGSCSLSREAMDSALKCGNALLGYPLIKESVDSHAPTRQACDQWTASFFQPAAPHRKSAGRIAEELRFFHWQIEFPPVFSGTDPGFDCVLGNPPWERIKLQEREFFAGFASPISQAGKASVRQGMIRCLKKQDPALYAYYQQRHEYSMAFSRFLRTSKRYSLASRGDPNLYLFFAELSRELLAPKGRVGIIVPSGIARIKAPALSSGISWRKGRSSVFTISPTRSGSSLRLRARTVSACSPWPGRARRFADPNSSSTPSR